MSPITLLLLIFSVAPLAVTTNDRVTVSEVPCKSVADCWLDAGGKPIARPKAKRGQRIPNGDCGNHHQWLRNRLRCEEQRCVSERIGDRC
jgi:hypothetical protein